MKFSLITLLSLVAALLICTATATAAPALYNDQALQNQEAACAKHDEKGQDKAKCDALAAQYDKCNNLAGWQMQVPAGLVQDASGACVAACQGTTVTGVSNRSGTLVISGCGLDHAAFFEALSNYGYLDIYPGNTDPRVTQTITATEATYRSTFAPPPYSVTRIRYDYNHYYYPAAPVLIF